MATVVISGVSPDPNTYVSAVSCTTFVTGMYGTTYTNWLTLSLDDKGRSILSATRYMDKLGLTSGGVAIGYTTTIQPVIDACCELAVLIYDDPEVMASMGGSGNIQSVSTGGSSVSFFSSSVPRGTGSGLPFVIQQLLGPYLPATSATSPTAGTNGNDTTDFDSADTYSKIGPY